MMEKLVLFFGILLGLPSIGHSVCVFPGRTRLKLTRLTEAG